ncbi:MAG: hypothetical protein ABSD31_21320 [Candidatus Binataceae bacterium]|jgi:putative membrane protein
MGLNQLTSGERERINAALKNAADRTSAGFALVIVPISDRYALFPVLWAAVIAISVTGIVALLRPGYTILTGFLINGGLFIALALLLEWMPLRMRIVPGEVKRRLARELAHHEFAVRILAPATHRSGVMFFVSLAERYVEIIADREIHARVGSGAWDKTVADFVRAARENRLANGLIAAVESCASILETHYPASGVSG